MVGMGAGLMAPVALGQGEEWRILEGDDPPAGWKVCHYYDDDDDDDDDDGDDDEGRSEGFLREKILRLGGRCLHVMII